MLPKTPVTQEERSSVLVTGYDLDVHLLTEESKIESHVTLTVRNASGVALARIPLQISSTLRWQTISEMATAGLRPVSFTQSPIATDADHTGYAQEAVVTLGSPLAPGASLRLSVFYVGEIRRSGARLELLGTAADRAAEADWDEIVPTSDEGATALRGFGNVLWYPVAAPTAVLGDGNKLVELTGKLRLAESSATVRLRLAVEYAGDPPVAAIFNGELKPLVAAPDEQDQAVTQTHGLATAEFGVRRLGFRALSLFLTAQPAETGEGEELSLISPQRDVALPYADAVTKVRGLITDWFGVTPITPLILLDHTGDTFEDGALLVTELDPQAKADDLAAELMGPLTHAWFRSGHPWISEGLAGFLSLLWTERSRGHDAAIAALGEQATLIALTEPDLSSGVSSGGEALTEASSPIYFGYKAASVWWQLRGVLGEDVLRQGLVAYRHEEAAGAAFDADPKSMERTLERVSGKDLGWFFEDWVYRDRSLPDLTILEVNPRSMPDKLGRDSGYLVAVQVRNDGDAVAEVPVIVTAGSGSEVLSERVRLRIQGHATASARIVFRGDPESVQVNDGSVPELRSSVHTRAVKIQRQ